MRDTVLKKPDKPNAQLILLSGFMIMLGTLTFMILLNNLILTANLPTSGLDISKQDIKEFRTLTISEVNYATQATLQYSEDNGTTNETLLREYFMNYTDIMGETLSRVFASRGTSVEMKVNNVTFTSSITNRTITVQYFRPQKHQFPNTSLIIPMDGYQNNTLQVYRFIWNIANNTSVPVHAVVQNPVNMSNISSNPPNMTNISIDDFYLNLTTDDIARPQDGPGNVMNRTYSGGPFLIDIRNLNDSTRNYIYNESQKFTPPITIHGLRMDGGIYLENTRVFTDIPNVAVYPDTDPGLNPIVQYYSDMMIPYTLLNDSDILSGNLTLENYSVLLIHYNMSTVDGNITSAIVNWTADGGVLYAECLGAVTMDAAVEAVDNNTLHPWFGFIGINESNLSSVPLIPDGPYVKLINSSSSLNYAPPMPLSGLVEDGASFNPSSQTNNTSGMYGPGIGHPGWREAFTLNNTTSSVNPQTNIIGYAAYPNGSQIIFDVDGDNESEYHLTYVEASFENGRVIYMAGHNLSTRGIQAERIVAEIFYASVSREELALETNNVNVSITYTDGRATFEDTFLITI
ncbi:MAG: hypothetical protein P1P80_04920 [ANME-2 cluster archaeon]|nr:hypothetical protein [ANME-2 cluster archaeon]